MAQGYAFDQNIVISADATSKIDKNIQLLLEQIQLQKRSNLLSVAILEQLNRMAGCVTTSLADVIDREQRDDV